MKLTLAGVSHHRAPIELRERVALDLEACRALAAAARAGEAVVLSTCNRTELYLARDEHAEEEAVDALDRARRRPRPTTSPPRCTGCGTRRRRSTSSASPPGSTRSCPARGRSSARCGRRSRPARAGPFLDRLFRQALHTGRRVRVETAIGESPASVPSAAAALAQQVFGELDGHRVLLLGAGKMSEAAARNLVSRGAEIAVVANRTLAHGEDLARKLGARGARARRGRGGARAGRRRRLGDERRRARPLARGRRRGAARAQGPAAPARRPRRPARPRPRDQRARRLLPLRRRRPRGRRRPRRFRAAAARRRGPSGSSPRRPTASATGRPRSTSSRRSRRCARSPRRSATASSRQAGGRLSERERKHVESVTSQILAKLLHLPTIRMKEAAAAADGVVYADVVRHLFGLEEEERRR